MRYEHEIKIPYLGLRASPEFLPCLAGEEEGLCIQNECFRFGKCWHEAIVALEKWNNCKHCNSFSHMYEE